LKQEKKRIAAMLAAGDPELLSTDNLQAVAAWEAEISRKLVHWRPLADLQISAEQGSQLEVQPDASFLAKGDRPDRDVYTIVGDTSLPRVSALRIDFLTDDSLPHQGPGRHENGNLHLNELQLSQVVAPDSEQRLELNDPRADFNQEGWSVSAAIDGSEDSAWGIHPQVGKPHHATFSLQSPLTRVENTSGETPPLAFKVVLRQTHGRGHLIGRFRISVTDAALPLPTDETTLPDDIRAILAAERSARTPQQQATLSHFVLSERIDAQIAALPAPSLVYAGASDFKPDGSFKPAGAPRKVYVLNRGIVTDPLREAVPGALSCVAGMEDVFPGDPSVLTEEGDRRAALARWLSDTSNGLVWRSIANRVWQHHFGRGLVETANDFGRMGAAPTHPELLDWLAVYLLEHGGSLKALHRLIVTSSTWRQSSAHRDEAAAIDQDNRLLWRMNRRRLDAESFHDALLAASGTLDSKMGGPSVRQFIETKGVHVTPNVDYLSFSAADPANYRRSVYRFIFRTLPDPLMDALDCPDASQLTPQRTESLTALQALATLNDKFVVRQSEHLAERIEQAAAGADRVAAAFRLILGREPSADESSAVIAYAARHGWANACRFLVNTNEFLFVE
jgi:hypothetical protein